MSRDGVVVAGPRGRIEVTGAALAGLVVHAAETVAGVRVRRPRRGLDVSVDGTAAAVTVELAAPIGSSLPEVGLAAQNAVAEALRASAGLEARIDVLFAELSW